MIFLGKCCKYYLIGQSHLLVKRKAERQQINTQQKNKKGGGRGRMYFKPKTPLNGDNQDNERN